MNKWNKLYKEAASGMEKWREGEKRASLARIEEEVDSRLAKLRAQMISDLAQKSANSDLSSQKGEKRAKCPRCGGRLSSNGKKKRRVITNHEQIIELERSQGRCPSCGTTVFPPR